MLTSNENTIFYSAGAETNSGRVVPSRGNAKGGNQTRKPSEMGNGPDDSILHNTILFSTFPFAAFSALYFVTIIDENQISCQILIQK
jgi:hypothetical protein